MTFTPSMAAETRTQLSSLATQMRTAADHVETVLPFLPQCDVADCKCTAGGANYLVVLLAGVYARVENLGEIMAAWREETITEQGLTRAT